MWNWIFKPNSIPHWLYGCLLLLLPALPYVRRGLLCVSAAASLRRLQRLHSGTGRPGCWPQEGRHYWGTRFMTKNLTSLKSGNSVHWTLFYVSILNNDINYLIYLHFCGYKHLFMMHFPTLVSSANRRPDCQVGRSRCFFSPALTPTSSPPSRPSPSGTGSSRGRWVAVCEVVKVWVLNGSH